MGQRGRGGAAGSGAGDGPGGAGGRPYGAGGASAVAGALTSASSATELPPAEGDETLAWLDWGGPGPAAAPTGAQLHAAELGISANADVRAPTDGRLRTQLTITRRTSQQGHASSQPGSPAAGSSAGNSVFSSAATSPTSPAPAAAGRHLAQGMQSMAASRRQRTMVFGPDAAGAGTPLAGRPSGGASGRASPVNGASTTAAASEDLFSALVHRTFPGAGALFSGPGATNTQPPSPSSTPHLTLSPRTSLSSQPLLSYFSGAASRRSATHLSLSPAPTAGPNSAGSWSGLGPGPQSSSSGGLGQRAPSPGRRESHSEATLRATRRHDTVSRTASLDLMQLLKRSQAAAGQSGWGSRGSVPDTCHGGAPLTSASPPPSSLGRRGSGLGLPMLQSAGSGGLGSRPSTSQPPSPGTVSGAGGAAWAGPNAGERGSGSASPVLAPGRSSRPRLGERNQETLAAVLGSAPVGYNRALASSMGRTLSATLGAAGQGGEGGRGEITPDGQRALNDGVGGPVVGGVSQRPGRPRLASDTNTAEGDFLTRRRSAVNPMAAFLVLAVQEQGGQRRSSCGLDPSTVSEEGAATAALGSTHHQPPTTPIASRFSTGAAQGPQADHGVQGRTRTSPTVGRPRTPPAPGLG